MSRERASHQPANIFFPSRTVVIRRGPGALRGLALNNSSDRKCCDLYFPPPDLGQTGAETHCRRMALLRQSGLPVTSRPAGVIRPNFRIARQTARGLDLDRRSSAERIWVRK